jgi:hypothetical protein
MDKTKIVRPPVDRLQNVPWPNPEQVRIYCEQAVALGFYDGCPAAIRDAVLALDEPFTRLQDAITECSKSQAPHYFKHLEDLAARVAAGGQSDEKDGWSREDFAEDALERRRAFLAKAREITNQAWALVEPELHHKADALDSLADQVQAEELERSKAWGWNVFGPWVNSIRKLAAQLRDGSLKSGGKPSSLLQYL